MNEKACLEGFKNGVSIGELSEHLFSAGVMVKLKFGRKRLSFGYDIKGFGIDISELSSKEFVNGHVKGGKIFVLPPEVEARLKTLESAIRNRQKRASTALDGQFMPMDAYLEFREDFEQTRSKYFEIRDEIVASWDQLVGDYHHRLEQLLLDFKAIEREKQWEKLSKLPTKQEYYDSFSMNLQVQTMPKMQVDESFENVSDEFEKIQSQNMLNVVVETMVSGLQKVYDLSNSAISSYVKRGTVQNTTITGLKYLPKKLRTVHTVTNHPLIGELLDILKDIHLASNDEIVAASEILLTKVYFYGKDNHLPLKGEPALEASQMQTIKDFY